MKNKIAPEIDGLMWKLAEEGNERAIDEFGTRHPEYRTELLRRMSMVDGLRSAKKQQPAPPPSIPRFIPKEPHGLPPTGRRVVFALVLAAMAAFAFAATVLLTPAHHPPAPDPKPPEATQVKPEPAPVVVEKPATTSTPPPVVDTPRRPSPEDIADQFTERLNIKQKALKIDHAAMLTVVKMIGESSKVKIIPAPGLDNPTIEVDYANMSAFEMLQDLGRKYSFIPVDEHDGSVLLVPGVDKGNHIEGLPTDGNPAGKNISGRKIGG